MPFDIKTLGDFTTGTGVYLMKNRHGTVLYIGKAKNLRQRIRQYFVSGGDERLMIPFLRPLVDSIETIIVHSEKEALLLENNLIKKYKPKYNALLKDDKSYIALKVTRHIWPRVDLVRYRGKPKADGLYFGPYTSAMAARKTLDLLHKIFPLRQCSDVEFSHRTRPCILYDIKRCIAPCVGYCTKEDYDELLKKTIRFLRGQDKEIVDELYKEMHRYSSELEFEKAGAIWQTIAQIEKTIEGQNVDRPLGGDVDALGVFRQGEEVILSQLEFREGKLMTARHYNFTHIAQDDSELIHSFILQHYEPLESLPEEILLPIPLSEAKVLEEILSQKGCKVTIETPKRGHKKAVLEIAYKNAEAMFKKDKDARSIRERTLLEMQEKFNLTRYPKRIECFDISHMAGALTVASSVAFTDGEKDSSDYRKYKVKEVSNSDDYAAMREVLTRRLKKGKEENALPDLIMIDGGKGHLNVALRVLQDLNIISVDLISIAKEEGSHGKGITAESVFLPNIKDPIRLKTHSSILFMLQRIRDEAHRFAITYHRQKRTKSMVRSILDDINGIGPAKKKKLLTHFGSLKAIKEASKEEIAKVPGISKKDAEAIQRKLLDLS